MKKNPAISVVMATYNGEQFLEEQIGSILDQTLPPSEFLVCDDGSTDGTIAILEKYQRKGRLKLFINDRNLGYAGNFKKAVSLAAEGHYVALSDQDDVWRPDKLLLSAERLAAIEKPEIPCMVYSDLIVVDRDRNLLNPSFRSILGQGNYPYNLKTLLFGNFVNGCTIFMNPCARKYMSSLPDDLYHDAWLALATYTFGNAESLPEPQVEYRQHTSNVTFSTAYQHQSRLRRVLAELLSSIRGNAQIFRYQFTLVRRFYDTYGINMDHETRRLFEEFLTMENKSYLSKKLAFRKAMQSR